MFNEEKIKYLEMIQSIITRMASNSFMLKGWSVTLMTGVFAISFSSENKCILYLAIVPIFAFWILDSYYLQLERKYRELYKQTLTIETSKISFELNCQKYRNGKKTKYYSSFFSMTELGFYGPQLLVTITIILLVSNV